MWPNRTTKNVVVVRGFLYFGRTKDEQYIEPISARCQHSSIEVDYKYSFQDCCTLPTYSPTYLLRFLCGKKDPTEVFDQNTIPNSSFSSKEHNTEAETAWAASSPQFFVCSSFANLIIMDITWELDLNHTKQIASFTM